MDQARRRPRLADVAQMAGVDASVVLRDAGASAVAVTHLAELGNRRICGSRFFHTKSTSQVSR